MFAKLIVVLALVAVASAFSPVGRMSIRTTTMSSSTSIAKVIGAAGAAATLMGGAAFAVEGASPKQ